MDVTGEITVFAAQKPQNANIAISTRSVEDLTKLMSARRERRVELEPCAKHPCYTHGLLWDDEDDILSATTKYSLTATPVPCVPIKELSNEGLMNTIHTNPHLFKINCRINVEHFTELLQHHHNQPFIISVCHSL